MDKPFDTNSFFAGGAGMFLQYHDVIKPAYLYSVMKMMITGQSYGLPIQILQGFSILSILEWYKKRRYKNPLQQLDWAHKIPQEQLDRLLLQILRSDPSIYRLSPLLNVGRLFHVYRQQHMAFPVFVYSEEEEPSIREDCKSVLNGISFHYLHGDLKQAIQNCDQNFTYIFSDIELVKNAAEILVGTCSHILLTSDYRYNYRGMAMKYDLAEIMSSYPYVRTSTTVAMDIRSMSNAFNNITQGGE